MQIKAKEEVWPLKNVFRISRGSRTEARVVVVTVSDGDQIGCGECVPIRRYNQSCESVIGQIESIKRESALDRQSLQKLLPAGAARNALDCALWDLEAKRSGKPVWQLANIRVVDQIETSFTISLDSPDKLGGNDVDLARVQAVCEAAPNARLLIDANESWSPERYRKIVPALKELGVELIEQPFPADHDEILQRLDHPLLCCGAE